jgi:hypothetical protein
LPPTAQGSTGPRSSGPGDIVSARHSAHRRPGGAATICRLRGTGDALAGAASASVVVCHCRGCEAPAKTGVPPRGGRRRGKETAA